MSRSPFLWIVVLGAVFFRTSYGLTADLANIGSTAPTSTPVTMYNAPFPASRSELVRIFSSAGGPVIPNAPEGVFSDEYLRRARLYFDDPDRKEKDWICRGFGADGDRAGFAPPRYFERLGSGVSRLELGYRWWDRKRGWFDCFKQHLSIPESEGRQGSRISDDYWHIFLRFTELGNPVFQIDYYDGDRLLWMCRPVVRGSGS